ncbi:MAG: icmG dotF [Gammaproteobacteria bacterium]|jgi:hypothetical protein|nr:icmG dotF [Gammaproteobacteria bacterium]
MSDEIYKPDSDDEYQFTDNETAVVYKAEKKNSVKGMLAQRRIWLAFAIIVIGIVGYKLLGVFTSKEGNFPEKSAALPKIGQTLPEPQVTPVITSEPALQPSTVNNHALLTEQDLANVKQRNQEDTARLSRLENRFNGVDNDFSLLKEQLNQLRGELRTLSTQLNNLQQKLPKPAEHKPVVMAKPKNQKPPAPVVSRPTYHVQAVLPGRAWLVRDEDSATITVAVGDILPGYGTIININPTRASVITSTGYTIPYKPD